MNNIDSELLKTVYFYSREDGFPGPDEIADALSQIDSLLKAGADPNFTTVDYSFQTPLHLAVEYDYGCAVLGRLIGGGADVNKADDTGLTPLMVACSAWMNEERKDHFSLDILDVITLLIESGADVNATCDSGMSAFMYAAAQWNLDVLTLLLEAGADANTVDESGSNALTKAASDNEDIDVIKWLVEIGLDINATDGEGRSLLMLSVSSGRQSNKDITSFLIESTESLETTDEDGMTALTHAASTNNLEATSLLIQAGADVNAGNGMAVRWAAMKSRSTDIISALMGAGADVRALDSNGANALDWAADNHNAEMTRLLIRSGIPVNDLPECSRPLCTAARFNENPEVISVLIEAGAQVNGADPEGVTPVAHAFESNRNPEILFALLDGGANLGNPDKSKLMEWLISSCQIETGWSQDASVITQLLEYGADVNGHDEEGRTPLIEMAKYSGRSDLLQLLIDSGADPNIKDADGNNALMEIYNGGATVWISLIKSGTDALASNDTGMTPFLTALTMPVNQTGIDFQRDENAQELLSLFLKAGADVFGFGIDSNPHIIEPLKNTSECPIDYKAAISDLLACDRNAIGKIEELRLSSDALSVMEDETNTFYERTEEGISGGRRHLVAKGTGTYVVSLDEASLREIVHYLESDELDTSVGDFEWQGGGGGSYEDEYDDSIEWNTDTRGPFPDDEDRIDEEDHESEYEGTFIQDGMKMTLANGTQVDVNADKVKPVIRAAALSYGIEIPCDFETAPLRINPFTGESF